MSYVLITYQNTALYSRTVKENYKYKWYAYLNGFLNKWCTSYKFKIEKTMKPKELTVKNSEVSSEVAKLLDEYVIEEIKTRRNSDLKTTTIIYKY